MTLTDSSSLLPKLFFKSAKNSFTISYSRFSNSKSFNIFSFYTSTDLLCIYNNIYLICFSTISPFIFILINNLYAVKNSKIFPTILSNTYVLATSVLDYVIGLDTTTSVPAPTATTSIAYIRVVDKELYFIFLILFFFNLFFLFHFIF